MNVLYPIPLKKQFIAKDYKFQVIDLEARNWTDFIVGGYYDGKEYFQYRNLDEITNYINESKKPLKIFAHYGGAYDFLFLLENFFKNKIDVQSITMRGSLILSVKIKGLYKYHVLRDSIALLPFSLKTLTNNFNVETKKGDYDHSLNRGYNEELAEYLKSDCLGLHQVLNKFFNSELVRKAGRATTIASQAQKILQTYLKEPVFSPNDEMNEYMREACHGGRTEIFKPLGSKIYEYDVNSLYPTVMKAYEYPSGRAMNTTKFHKNKFGIYTVKVKCPEIHIPIIPIKTDKKLLFPKGEFTTTITSVEIEYAKTLGYKFKILKGVIFTKKERYFQDFISELYAMRQKAEKNTVDNVLTKLIMNSSYGKFIIKKDKSNLVLNNQEGCSFYKELKVGSETIELFEKPVTLNSFNHCGIGAFILAYARIHMHKLMHPIAEHVYYTDTDSIWTDIKLPSSNELGDLKLELPKNKSNKEYYDKVCFLLPKTYIAESDEFKKVAMKGFDRRKITKLTFNEFNLALLGELKLSVDHDEVVSKFKTAIKNNKILTKKPKFTKNINSKYDKRIINLKTNRSEPIRLQP